MDRRFGSPRHHVDVATAENVAAGKTRWIALRTRFTDLLHIEHPIALAPMGGSAGGALAAAVSNEGGFGLIGGGPGDPGWLARELPVVAAGTDQPWGVGFQSWAVDVGTVERALQFSPRAGGSGERRV